MPQEPGPFDICWQPALVDPSPRQPPSHEKAFSFLLTGRFPALSGLYPFSLFVDLVFLPFKKRSSCSVFQPASFFLFGCLFGPDQPAKQRVGVSSPKAMGKGNFFLPIGQCNNGSVPLPRPSTEAKNEAAGPEVLDVGLGVPTLVFDPQVSFCFMGQQNRLGVQKQGKARLRKNSSKRN